VSRYGTSGPTNGSTLLSSVYKLVQTGQTATPRSGGMISGRAEIIAHLSHPAESFTAPMVDDGF
jgi:hypothetical protein